MNREVNLTKRIETAQGWRYCAVVLSANGRVKPDVVLVNKKEERHPEGAYYLEWRDGSKRVRLSVGKDAADAGTRPLRKEAELNLAQSFAINRRSRCGEVRGWPVLSSHFCPGAAPQVGQRMASTSFGLSSFFITNLHIQAWSIRPSVAKRKPVGLTPSC
jgi:hypothetical protein